MNQKLCCQYCEVFHVLALTPMFFDSVHHEVLKKMHKRDIINKLKNVCEFFDNTNTIH